MPSERIQAEIRRRREAAALRPRPARVRLLTAPDPPVWTPRRAPRGRAGLSIMRPTYMTYCRFVGDPLSYKKLHGFERVHLPDDVLPLDLLRGLPSHRSPPCEAGVYFLWRGPALLYIGQSSRLSDRLHSHWCAKVGLHQSKCIPFTWRSWLTCRADRREDIETLYIRAYMPPYNDKIP